MAEPVHHAAPEGAVHYAVTDAVATLTLDVPATRNALSGAVLAALRAHLSTAAQDPAVRVVVLSHTGPVFCSGMDLRTVADVPAADQPVRAFPALLTDIARCELPVVARVGGKARAGGIGLLAACDLAIGSDDADFAFTEVRLGVIPAVISRPVLRRMHPQTARRYFLTGSTFDARRAVQSGLLDAAVPPQELDAAVARYCAELALGGPDALSATKRLLDRAPADYAELSTLSAEHFASAEGQEGAAARREKRPPRWVP